VGAAGAAVELAVVEAFGLHRAHQRHRIGAGRRALAVGLDRVDPGRQQGARVPGVDPLAELAAPLAALADHPLGDPQHPSGVGVAGRSCGGERPGGDRDRRMRPLRGTFLRPTGRGATGAEVGKKLFRRRRGRGLRPGPADVDAGVVVRAADPDRPVGLGVDGGRLVELAGPGAVSDVPDPEQLGEAASMVRVERRGDGEEGVRERGDYPPFVDVADARLEVAGAVLERLVVRGRDPVAEDVDRLALAAEPHGELLGDEDVRTVGDLEAAVDGVVIGDRHEVHPPALGELVDLLGGSRALRQAEGPLDPELGDRRGARVAVHVGPRRRGNHRRPLPFSSRFVTPSFGADRGARVNILQIGGYVPVNPR
jgi:hypothetical protein